MLTFLDLPNDILYIIIEKISAGDISALASCHPSLHIACQKRLKFHRKKRAEAKTIRLGWAPFASAIHPLKHLEDMFKNDDIRFYTRKIEIGYLGPDGANSDSDRDEFGKQGSRRLKEGRKFIARMKSQYERRISNLVAEVYDALLPHAIEIDLREWTNKVISGEREAVVILLLALYPYLNILNIQTASLDRFNVENTTEGKESMSHEYRNEALWVNLFRSLTATAREPGTNRLKIFSKLSRFHLDGEEDQDHFQDNLGPITPFMVLPAMRRASCHNIAGCNVHWSYGIGTSNVTSLTLSGFVDKASLRSVISGLRRLTDFSYQIGNLESQDVTDYHGRTKWGPHVSTDDIANLDPDEDYSDPDNSDEEDPDQVVDAGLPRWEPRAITECLLQYACNSLTSLDLGALSFLGVSDLSDNEPFISSLRPFQVLRNVRLDTMMLFEKVERPKTISVIGKNSTQRKFQEAIKAQKLVVFLPSSIEEVCITCEYVGKGLSKRDVEAMFMGLPEQRNKLPKLYKFTFEWMVEWPHRVSRNLAAETEGWEELIRRCQDNEIEIRSNGEKGQPPSDAFPTTWSDSEE